MSKRQLPARSNPLLAPDHSPQMGILVERRRLGQTDLRVKAGQVGTSNATKVENLGLFDYAHLRAPLPQDLRGSEMHWTTRGANYPEHYFLMRRSSDGYISATGLFKAAFPWASKAEENHEREYLKGLGNTDPQEVAGNVWVPPQSALRVASDYGITTWVEALLNPEPIEQNNEKHISSPPRFNMAKTSTADHSTKSARKRTASREVTSPSPSRMPAPARPKATPRRHGGKKKNKVAEATPSIADSAADSEDIEDATETITEAVADAITDAAVDAAAEVEPLAKNTARVTVNSDVQDDGMIETTRTSVKVEMPADAPSQPLPESPEEALETAKKIVADAKSMQAAEGQTGPGAPKSRKRKAAEAMELLEPEEEIVEELTPAAEAKGHGKKQFGERKGEPPAKRIRIMVPATEFRRQKMQKRALMGLSATLAVGAMIPWVSTLF